METTQNNCSNASLLRSMAIGASILFAVTAPGICFYLYQWIVTGNASQLGEAITLFAVATSMGASGGAAYNLVNRSRMKSSWKPFVAWLAAIEAYILTFSLTVLILSLVAPNLNKGLPLGDVGFYLGLHAYGVFLCVVAFGLYFAPRIATITIICWGLLLQFLSIVVVLIIPYIGIENGDTWFMFLKMIFAMSIILLVALVLVSVFGWVRYYRGIIKG
jgi:hypothetical protein